MKKSELKERLKIIKATVLSGTIMLSFTGCGHTNEEKDYGANIGDNKKIVNEIDPEIGTQSDYSVKIDPVNHYVC